jgi:hypothetical protein
VLRSLFFDVPARNVQFSGESAAMIDPRETKCMATAIANNQLAKTEGAGQRERDRKGLRRRKGNPGSGRHGFGLIRVQR